MNEQWGSIDMSGPSQTVSVDIEPVPLHLDGKKIGRFFRKTVMLIPKSARRNLLEFVRVVCVITFLLFCLWGFGLLAIRVLVCIAPTPTL